MLTTMSHAMETKRTDANNFTLHGDVVTYAHGTVCTESSGTDRDKLSDTGKSIYTTPTSRWGPPSRASDSPTVLTPPGFVTRVTQGKPLISNRRNALHCAQKSPRNRRSPPLVGTPWSA